MRAVLDALGRAAAYCLHWRVIALSLAPLVLAGGGAALAGWVWWERALDAVRATLENWALVEAMLRWVEAFVGVDARTLIAPLIVVVLALPCIVLLALLIVALVTTPAIVRLVARRRFPTLVARRGASWWQAAWRSLASSVVALLALVLSLPLWLIPPLVLVLPPLIWGWLTYRVMAFDVLAEHASADERRSLLRAHRLPLLAIGVACGALGAAPGALAALAGFALLPLAPVLVPAIVWLYTLVFSFSALWFAHYALAALAAARAGENGAP